MSCFPGESQYLDLSVVLGIVIPSTVLLKSTVTQNVARSEGSVLGGLSSATALRMAKNGTL